MENEQLEKMVAEEESKITQTTSTKTEKTYNGKFVSTQKISILKMLKNKTFMFWMIFILFVLSFFCLTMMDSNNTWRPHQLDGLANLLAKWNLSIDVTMSVWFIFFLLFGLVMCAFFCFSFYNYFHFRIEKKIRTDEQREPVDKDFVLFKVLFFTIPSLLFIGGVIAVVVVFNQRGWWSIMGKQLANFGQVAGNFGICLALIFGMILIPIIVFFVVILLLKLVGLILGIVLVGPLSQSIVKSEEFRHEMETDNKMARGIIQINNPTNLDMSKLDSKDAKFYVSGNNPKDELQQEGGDIFPALTAIDKKWADKAEAERIAKEEEERKAAEAAAQANNPENNLASEIKTEDVKNDSEVTAVTDTRKKLDYESFKVLAYEFQSYLCHQKYYFDLNTIRSFIAGLAAARLILLEGLSGTGKTTLPRVFLEYVGGKAYFFPVQATWRDRSDITGYYSDFTSCFKETELLKHLYEARYTPENVNLLVLDEMNISRVEYYFADFLSIFEYPSNDWLVPLMQIRSDATNLPKYIEGGFIRIPTNTWFVGTVNIDDSTFTITDKVYDRAIVIDFDKLNLPFESSYRHDPHRITLSELENMFKVCKEKKENNLTPAERKKFLDLTAFIGDTFDIAFGNRIMNQVDNFLPVFVGLGGTKEEALDIMFARKILRKLDGRFETYIKDGLNKLTRYLNTTYGKHTFKETEKLIEKFRKKLS